MLPRRREANLLVRNVSDETLVYDLERYKAHCLNPTAAAVWQHCDGRTSVSQLAGILRRERQIAADDDVVWLALRQLQKARLLQERLQPRSNMPRLSRRELIRKLGAAAAVPVVMTIMAPTAEAQGSVTCSGPSPGPLGECKLLRCPIGTKCDNKPNAAICSCT